MRKHSSAATGRLKPLRLFSTLLIDPVLSRASGPPVVTRLTDVSHSGPSCVPIICDAAFAFHQFINWL